MFHLVLVVVNLYSWNFCRMNEDSFYVGNSCMVRVVWATRRTRGRVMELMNSFHKLRCIYIPFSPDLIFAYHPHTLQ